MKIAKPPRKPETISVGLRLTPQLRDEIKREAAKSGVTLAAFLSQLIGWSFDRHLAEEARRAAR